MAFNLNISYKWLLLLETGESHVKGRVWYPSDNTLVKFVIINYAKKDLCFLVILPFAIIAKIPLAR